MGQASGVIIWRKVDFLKLTNVTLGYTLPLKGTITNYVNNVRVFAFCH